MKYQLQDIADQLKKARETRGISQRALSEIAGVPQSHLSKIENGNVDIRLSSLIEIARALDLEIQLIPKQAVPAVTTVVKSTAPPIPDKYTKAAWQELNLTEDAVKKFLASAPDISEWSKTQKLINELKHYKFSQEDLQTLKKSFERNGISDFIKVDTGVKALKKSLSHNEISNFNSDKALIKLKNSLKSLKEQIGVSSQNDLTIPKSAYSLGDDDE